MKYSICILTIIVAVVQFSAAAEIASQVDLRRKSKMLEIGMTVLPKTADPRDQWNFQHILVIQSVYQTLVRVSESGRTVSDLAERWQVDLSGKIYTFELNPKALFHDGSPVMAADVAFSLARHFGLSHLRLFKIS